MELKDIMAITGQPGLYQYLSQGRNGIIVEGIDDKKRIFVPATAKISSLSDIAIFTEKEEVSLKEVFKKIRTKENGGPAISHKVEDAELKKYFEAVLPDYDREKVYVSDIKKVFNWYNVLQKNNQLAILDVEEKEEDKPAEDLLKKEQKHIEKPMQAKVKETKPRNQGAKQTGAVKKTGQSSSKKGS